MNFVYTVEKIHETDRCGAAAEEFCHSGHCVFSVLFACE